MTTTLIRHFNIDELDAVYAVEQASNSYPWSKNILASCIGGRYISRLVTDGSAVLGFYVADTVVDEMTLMEICVSPAFQGQGLGQQLLSDLISQAQQQHIKDIHLEVRAGNQNAIQLYRKNGFIDTYRRRDYYPSNNGKEDALIMQLSL